MARAFLYIVAFLVFLVLAAMIALRYWAADLSTVAFVPKTEYRALAPLEDGAYASHDMWLARPGMGRGDPSRALPGGFKPDNHSMGAAVFFVHPTSYFSADGWNAPLEDTESRQQATAFLQDMASPFNASADLWAPGYRQAAFGAFLTDEPAADKALDAAYGDIEAAFERFVATIDDDSPIVLVGHSQGAFHLRRLIAEHVANTPLRKRVAAAYLIGWPISIAHDLPALGLPACTGPGQPGCVASWQSFAEPAETDWITKGAQMRGWLDWTRGDGRPYLCSNPLAGMASKDRPASANAGSLIHEGDDGKAQLVKALVPARCSDDGVLLIGDPPDLGKWVLPGNNYHVYDIPMFWANLRRDVGERVDAWQATR